MRSLVVPLLLVAILASASASVAAFVPSGLLEIHVMSVKHTNAMLVVGPDGTRILMDAGKNAAIDYLGSIGLQPVPADRIHCTVASHLDSDHIQAFDNILDAGYTFGLEDGTPCNYDNGSDRYDTQTIRDYDARLSPQAVTLGQTFDLGDGASIKIVAVHCQVWGGGIAADCKTDDDHENDVSMAALIRYKDFDFLWAGDLGGDWVAPPGEEQCPNRETPHGDGNIESVLAAALTAGPSPVIGPEGVDVLHVSHHGADSSTNHEWMNAMRPEVAVISTGPHASYGDPEPGVVDDMLLAGCDKVTVDPALTLQTDEGDLAGDASPNGHVVGSIIIETDGVFYGIGATGMTADEEAIVPDERGAGKANLPTIVLTDDNAGDCPFDTTLTGPLMIDSEWKWKAMHALTTEGSVRVAAGGRVTLQAAGGITLGDGFQVDAGAELIADLAVVVSCDDSWPPEAWAVATAG